MSKRRHDQAAVRNARAAEKVCSFRGKAVTLAKGESNNLAQQQWTLFNHTLARAN